MCACVSCACVSSVAPQVKGSVVKSAPYTACSAITNAEELRGRIALAVRGECMFASKARRLQEAGVAGVIFIGRELLRPALSDWEALVSPHSKQCCSVSHVFTV